MGPSFFVPVSTEALSLRDCINVCGAAGGMPACASALAITSNVQCNGTEAGTCDVWLGHHRHEFDNGPFDSCLASPTAEPAAPVALAGQYSGSNYGIPGDCCVLSAGELFEVPCDYHSNFEGAAQGLRCLCETPGSVASTAEAVAWVDAWTAADLERRRDYLVPAILACAGLALLPWLITCIVACIRGCYRKSRATATSDTEAPASERLCLWRLRNATLTAARLHARIKRVLLGLGWTLVCIRVYFFGTIGWTVSGINGLFEPITIPSTWFFILLAPGVFLMMLSVQPIDAKLIRLVSVIFFSLFTLFGSWALRAFLSPSTTSGAWAGTIGIMAFAAICTASTLRCNSQGRQTMPPRAALRRLWIIVRALFFLMGVSFMVLGLRPSKLLDESDEIVQTELGRGVAGLCIFVSAALCTPRNRGRLHRWLGSLGASGTQEQEAAALASLISGRSGGVAQALSTAKEMFRVLPLSNLTAADLASNADTGLNARVKHAGLGECDAFVSHSWRDDGDLKYAKLLEHKFISAAPTIWLDKACIDQGNIEASLSVLPVFLSSCKELLILPGPTYATRLWCVMEIFVFVQMGGEHERAVILPLTDDDYSDADLLDKLVQFDAGKAECFLPGDRHKLLATIEASFGTFHPFNKVVSGIFQDKLVRRRGREDSDDAEAAVDEEAARRVVWIQYHLRLGNYDEATELGWDGGQ